MRDLPNPFMRDASLYARARDYIPFEPELLSVNEAKGRLQIAQWRLRAFRIALGSAEREKHVTPYFLAMCRANVRRHELRFCEALDQLWTAQQ